MLLRVLLLQGLPEEVLLCNVMVVPARRPGEMATGMVVAL